METIEVLKYGLQVLGIGFLLYLAAYQTIRFLKSKGILKTRKLTVGPWKKKNQEDEKPKLDDGL